MNESFYISFTIFLFIYLRKKKAKLDRVCEILSILLFFINIYDIQYDNSIILSDIDLR